MLVDNKGRELEKYDIPTAAVLRVKENETVGENQVLCEWNPHKIPIICEVGGKVRFDDVVEGETMRVERDPGGGIRMLIVDHKGDLHPQIVIEDADGKPLDVYYLPERAVISVQEGKLVTAGTDIAEMPRESKGVSRHHRWSAASHRDFRSSQAKGSSRDRRSRRCGRIAANQTPRQANDYRSQRKRCRARALGATRQALLGSHRRRSSKLVKHSSTVRWCHTISCVSVVKKPCSNT